jgi:hypothetical protein
MHSETQAEIRRVVSAGEFDKASALWGTYAAQVTDAIRAGSCSAAELAQMGELVGWTRNAILCARAHAQRRISTRITKLHAATAYGRPIC